MFFIFKKGNLVFNPKVELLHKKQGEALFFTDVSVLFKTKIAWLKPIASFL